jgi:hypothetical protein
MKNVNNWKLIAVLAGLITILAGIKIFLSPTLESSLPQSLADIDSTKISELLIQPARERGSEIRLVRAGNRWMLKAGDRIGHLEQGGAPSAIASLMRLKPQRMVSKKKEKWNEFSVGDSTGTRVRVMAGDDVAADLWIGRTGFSQGSGGMFAGGGFTYVRLEEEQTVYAVDGFLEGQFNRGFNDWRDKSFTRMKSDSITRITFHYPADSSFVLEKKIGRWTSGPDLADSAAVASYLSSLEYKNVSGFSETTPAGEAPMVITFEKDTKMICKVEAWPSPGVWAMRSSHQPDTFFSSEGSTTKEIWKGRKELVKKGRTN